MNTLERIADLEDRIVNAKTIEHARRLHDELDALREKVGVNRTDYDRGYQAGYRAAMRRLKANKP